MIAAYVPLGSEPGSRELPDVLLGLGGHVLLPVLLPDGDLNWAEYNGPDSVRRAGRLLEPTGRRLGVEAITLATAVVVPAIAVDRSGVRLGRGGGSYDRALARVRPEVPAIALLYDGELVDSLPTEPHDHRVSAVIMPGTGLVELF